MTGSLLVLTGESTTPVELPSTHINPVSILLTFGSDKQLAPRLDIDQLLLEIRKIMAQINDAFAISDAWKHDLEHGPTQPQPNSPLTQWMGWLALMIRTTDRSLRARTKKDMEKVRRVLTRVAGLAPKEEPLERDDSPKEAIQGVVEVRLSGAPSKALESAGQVIFLCMDLEIKRALKKGRSKSVPPREKAFESDDQIVERMREIVGSELGPWAKFMPYYGVVGVEIVEVSYSCSLITCLLNELI
jgi:hypothetical protein